MFIVLEEFSNRSLARDAMIARPEYKQSFRVELQRRIAKIDAVIDANLQDLVALSKYLVEADSSLLRDVRDSILTT